MPRTVRTFARRLSPGRSARSCSNRPSAVRMFSTQTCSRWISAHCRGQKARCCSPRSGSASSSSVPELAMEDTRLVSKLESGNLVGSKPVELSERVTTTAVLVHMQQGMYLGRGVLASLGVMLPPQYLEYLHAAFGAGRGSVVLKELWEHSLDRLGILIAESGATSQLWVHAAIEDVNGVVNAVLHAHGVGSTLGAVALSTDALGNLRARHVNRLQTESGLHSHRSTDRDGNSRVAVLVSPFTLALFRQGKELAKSAHVEPRLARHSSRVGRTELAAECLLCTITQALCVVVLSIIRLHENTLPCLHEAVAQLALQADIRNLTVAVVISPWPISIQRVTVGVSVLHSKHHRKVDLMFKRAH